MDNNFLPYEIQAIAVEIDTLEKEKEELEERLRRLELENEQNSENFKSAREIFQIQGFLGEKQRAIDKLRREKEEKIAKMNRLEAAEKARKEKAQKDKMKMYEAQAEAIEKMEADRIKRQEEIEIMKTKKKTNEPPKRVGILKPEKEYDLPSELEVVIVRNTTTTAGNISFSDSFDDISPESASYVAGRSRSSFRAVSIRFTKGSRQVNTVSERVTARETFYQEQTVEQAQGNGRKQSTSTTTTSSPRKRGNICKYILSFLCTVILSIICPPLVVLALRGRDTDLCCNIILTLLGWIPGIVHAWYIIGKGHKENR